MNDVALQIFLLINVFIIGIVSTIAFRHAWAHYHPHPEDKKPQPAVQATHLPPVVKEQLLIAAKAKFQTAIDRATGELEKDLGATTDKLSAQLEKIGTDIIATEIDRYTKTLESLRVQTEKTIASAQTDVSAHQTDIHTSLTAKQTELEAKLAQDIADEKQRLIAQIDTKLADAVTSFLIDTLGHNVDLGSQNAYLISVLDSHKAELTQRVKDEA